MSLFAHIMVCYGLFVHIIHVIKLSLLLVPSVTFTSLHATYFTAM